MSTRLAELTHLREGQATLWLPPELSAASAREVIRWLQQVKRKIRRVAAQRIRVRPDGPRREPTEGADV